MQGIYNNCWNHKFILLIIIIWNKISGLVFFSIVWEIFISLFWRICKRAMNVHKFFTIKKIFNEYRNFESSPRMNVTRCDYFLIMIYLHAEYETVRWRSNINAAKQITRRLLNPYTGTIVHILQSETGASVCVYARMFKCVNKLARL